MIERAAKKDQSKEKSSGLGCSKANLGWLRIVICEFLTKISLILLSFKFCLLSRTIGCEELPDHVLFLLSTFTIFSIRGAGLGFRFN